METIEYPNGMVVVINDAGEVLRQLVKYERTPSGKTKFLNVDIPLSFPTKKEATVACRSMGYPLDRVQEGRSLMGRFYFIQHDFRSKYAVACWEV